MEGQVEDTQAQDTQGQDEVEKMEQDALQGSGELEENEGELEEQADGEEAPEDGEGEEGEEQEQEEEEFDEGLDTVEQGSQDEQGDRPDSTGSAAPSGLGTPPNPPAAADDDDEDADDDDMPMPNRLDLLSARSNSANSRNSRPPSAVMDLRGSRPNSAAIAQEIEGFEDDFMERVEEEDEEYYEDGYSANGGSVRGGGGGGAGGGEEDEEDMGPTVEELVDRAAAEQSRLQDINDILQKKSRLALDFRNKGRPPLVRDTSRLDGVSARYRSSLKQWIETLEDRDRVEGHYQSTVFDMKSTLEERIKRADDISKAYKHFRLEVAKSAEHSKTARPISERLLTSLEQEDQEKEEEVQRVRLKNIHLSNQLKRIENILRQKEELAEGLHLIDFEQLKIENQSLNEKIEERNEELLKLRKKTTTTVQILTHIREKLQFIEKENGSLATQLAELDSALSEKRDRLGKAKATRDGLRQKGRKIKDTSVFITSSSLLNDIEGQKERKEQLLYTIEETKKEYANLSELISKANTKIITLTEDMAATGAPSAVSMLRSAHSMKSGVGSQSSRSRISSRP